MLTERKIGVLMGGASAEREVSLRSGAAIYHSLKNAGYRCAGLDVREDVCSRIEDEGIEIAFLALHGGWGENGSVQGMLEILGIPYTGSGVLASALAMDKEASKKVFLYHGVPTPEFMIFRRHNVSREEPRFDLPWVVKPATEGSSVGVSILKSKEGLKKSLEEAFAFGDRVIVERYIAGQEINIGLLNDRVLGGVEVRPSLEFYSYEAKYTSGLTEYILPPEINPDVYDEAKKVALAANTALGCKGATRVDLRINGEGTSYVLEVNTIPGMTETSLLPKIAGLAGMNFLGLLEGILGSALHETE